MLKIPYGRRHVDDSFNKFGFFQVWHGVVAAFELGAAQPIAILQR
jgi:hypothetical protein